MFLDSKFNAVVCLVFVGFINDRQKKVFYENEFGNLKTEVIHASCDRLPAAGTTPGNLGMHSSCNPSS